MGPVEFLQAFTDGGPVNLVAIPPDGKPNGKTYRVAESGPAIASLVEKAGLRGCNLYFALNEPRPDLVGGLGKLKETDFAYLRGLAVDLDPREEVEREPGGWAAERERLLSLAQALTSNGPCPASVAIDTGNGVQLVWLFAVPIENTPETRALVKAQAAGLADALGGDAVQSVDHLFRLPGTRNFPNAKKRAKGRVETAARLLHLDVTRRYTLAELVGLAAPRDAKAAISVDLTDFDYPAVLEAAEGGPDALSQALQARVAELRERRGFAAAMENPDRSDRDYALAAHCVGAGMTDATEIASIVFALAADRLQEDVAKGRGEYYAGNTVKRALERAKRDSRPEDYFEVVATEGTGDRTSRFFLASDFAGRPVPPREWLVVDLVPRSTVTLFGGDGGTGKSLVALQLATAVASKTDWIGKAVTPGRAIYISAEDDQAELHRRLADILRATGRTFDDVQNLTLRSLAGEDALLATESNLRLVESTLFRELDARAEADRPSLIVIDTLADVYPANENDRAKVRQFVGMLRRLALKHRCAVILLAHPSLSGLNSGSGTSGSTAWNNSVRSRLYLSRVIVDGHEPDPDKRILSTKKANYGRIGNEVVLRWQRGVFEVAQQVVVTEGETDETPKAERVFLKLLRAFSEQGRKVNAAGGTTYAPNVFAKHPDSEGVTKAAFRAAMDALLSGRKVQVVEDGPPSKRRQFLEVVA
ncbi:MAG: AAA family ATPase [Tabrizicola sp.]|nr:AAA family ATPase [Tabrizicola sp.]